MDQVESLFPIPLLRCPRLLDPVLIEAAVAAIRGGRVEKNLRSDQLFHTEIANPRDNQLFRQMAEVAVPKLVDFGVLLFGERLRWTVKEMWTNMLETGGSQALHAHANSFASGIFYLTPSHAACKTVFLRPPSRFDFSVRQIVHGLVASLHVMRLFQERSFLACACARAAATLPVCARPPRFSRSVPNTHHPMKRRSGNAHAEA
jgi:hypothetical protein